MTGAVECRYYGRNFTADEMALLHALIAAEPQPNRAGLSREFCRRIGWFKPDGGLKDMMARVVMLAMHKDGLIELPPPKGRRNRPRPIVFGPDTEPPLLPAPTTLRAERQWFDGTVEASDRKELRRTRRQKGCCHTGPSLCRFHAPGERHGATRDKLYDKPRKDVWLRPLRRDWQRTLNRSQAGPSPCSASPSSLSATGGLPRDFTDNRGPRLNRIRLRYEDEPGRREDNLFQYNNKWFEIPKENKRVFAPGA